MACRNSWDIVVIEETNPLEKRFTIANASCLYCFYSILFLFSIDFIFIEMVFPFGYLELIMPRLAITSVCTFVCTRKTSYTFMRLRKVEWLLRPNRIWRVSYKCTVCVFSFIMNIAVSGERAKGEEIWCRKSEEKGKKKGAWNRKVPRCKVTA